MPHKPHLIPPTYLTWNGYVLSSPSLNSLGDRQIFIGQVDWLDNDTTKDIQNIRFLVNNRTIGTGTTMSLYLADLDTTSGNQIPRDDGIKDQFCEFPGLSGITPYTDNVSPNLSSNRTVTKGEIVCVVFEFTTFGASTSINIQPFGSWQSDGTGLPSYTYFDGTTYTNQNNAPAISFVFSDGTVGYFQGTYFPSYNAGLYTGTVKYDITTTGSTFPTTGNERGIEWTPSKPVKITGATYLHNANTSGSDAQFRAYKNDQLVWSQNISWTLTRTTGSGTSAYRYYDVIITPDIVTQPGDVLKFTTLATNTGSVVVPISQLRARYSGSDATYAKNGETLSTVTRFMSESITSSWTGSSTEPTAVYYWPQIFPRGEYLTSAEILTGSMTISGSVTVTGTPVSGATVRAIRQSDNVTISTSSATDGTYAFNVTSSNYHIIAEYESGGQKYNALSSWNVPPV